MRRQIAVIVCVLLLAFAASARAASLTIRGTVIALGERNFVVADAEGKNHIVWLVAASGYTPSDYRPALDDEVVVLCYYESRITKRLYLARVDFVKEGFKPEGEAARKAETPQVTLRDPEPAPAEPGNQ